MTLTSRQWATVAHRLAAPQSPAEKYMYDPVGWCSEFLNGFDPHPYQADILRSLVENGRTAAYGPHGLGKTVISAAAITWFATTREAAQKEWLIITTASVSRQLAKFLWPNVHKMIQVMDFEKLEMPKWERRTREITDQGISLKWGQAIAASSEDPDKLEGGHAKSLLVIFDEAKAIPGEAFDALEGAFSNAGADTGYEAYALAVSTPGPKTSRFWDICSQKKGYEDWTVRHVPVAEVIESRQASQEWVRSRSRQWGESSAVFINKCLGEFTEDNGEGFIPYEWIEDAHRRWHALQAQGVFDAYTGPLTIGLDPARTGQDRTVKAFYLPAYDALWKMVTEDYTPNLATLGRATAHETRQGRLVVDAAGLGSGVVDAARRMNACRTVEFQPAGKTPWKDRAGLQGAANKRTAAYYDLRDRLNPEYEPTLALPEDELLVGEILAQTPAEKPGDVRVYRLAPKDEVKKRLGRSPDRSDASSYGLWVDPQPRRLTARPTADLEAAGWTGAA